MTHLYWKDYDYQYHDLGDFGRGYCNRGWGSDDDIGKITDKNLLPITGYVYGTVYGWKYLQIKTSPLICKYDEQSMTLPKSRHQIHAVLQNSQNTKKAY